MSDLLLAIGLCVFGFTTCWTLTGFHKRLKAVDDSIDRLDHKLFIEIQDRLDGVVRHSSKNHDRIMELCNKSEESLHREGLLGRRIQENKERIDAMGASDGQR